jgi:methyltransferase (TIGR00027 family)
MRQGEVSMTARRVAAHRLSFEREPAPFGRPDDDDRLQVDVAAGLDHEPTMMTRYLQARTRFFDRIVVRSIDGGLEQIVAVGAGYDGRAMRYAKPGVTWFELDHPDTQADKRERLARLDIDTAGIAFAPIDFAVGDVADTLAAAGYDVSRRALFLCEGVAGYLSLDVLIAMLRALAGCAAGGSVLGITMSLRPETAEGEARRAALSGAVASMGEPLLNDVPRGELEGVLRGAGWSISRATDPAGVPLPDSTSNAAFVVARKDT